MVDPYDYNKSWRGDSQRMAMNLKAGEVIAIDLEHDDGVPDATEQESIAMDLAERFIESVGFDMSDSDQRGDTMGATVRDVLTFAFLRIGVPSVLEEAERSVWGSQA